MIFLSRLTLQQQKPSVMIFLPDYQSFSFPDDCPKSREMDNVIPTFTRLQYFQSDFHKNTQVFLVKVSFKFPQT